jgi:hypothetical protein
MQDLYVTIPHQLSREEAKRRIQEQLGALAQQTGMAANVQGTWAGDTMAFSFDAMGQSLPGRLAVDDQAVHLTLTLPWLLRMLAGTFRSRIEQQGKLLLADRR